MLERKNYNSIDIAKFIASFLVVAIHTHPFEGTEVDYYFTCFCRIAVPFFFVATSYFFFRRPSPDIRSYTKRLAILYLVWFIIELPIVYQRFFVDFDQPIVLQFLNFIRSLFFNNTWFASWYIMASIIAVNIIYYSQKHFNLNNTSLLIFAGGGYLISLISAGYYGAFDLLLNNRFQHYHSFFSWCFCPANSFIVALVYIMIGKLLAEGNWSNFFVFQTKKITLLVFSLLFLTGIIEVYLMRWSVKIDDAFIFLPFLSLFIFVILLETDITINPATAKWLRNQSILIYCLHPICRYINVLYFNLNNGPIMFVYTIIESLLLSFIIIKMSKWIPLLKHLY